MIENIRLKRGDTLSFEITIEDQDGNAIENINEVKSQIRDSRYQLIDEFNIVSLGGGKYKFLVDDTRNYPIADLQFDIQITKDDVVSSSETIRLSIVKDVTFDD